MPGPGDNRKKKKREVHRGLAGISAASLGAGHCSVGKHVRHKTNRWETRLFTSCVLPGPTVLSWRVTWAGIYRTFYQAPMAPGFRTPPSPPPQVQKMLQEGSLKKKKTVTSKPLTWKDLACTKRRIGVCSGIPGGLPRSCFPGRVACFT